MNIYLPIIKAFLNKATFDKYHNSVNGYKIKENHKEIYQILLALKDFWAQPNNQGLESINVSDLALHLYATYPTLKESTYSLLFAELETMPGSPSVETYLASLKRAEYAINLAREAITFSENKTEFASLEKIYENIKILSKGPVEEEKREEFVNTNITQVLSDEISKPGLYWALPSLNKSLGPLRKGNFGFLFARPETGKTTFLAHNVTAMAKQAEGPIIWFNNEEPGANVMVRCYQAAFGISLSELHSDPAKWELAFQAQIGKKLKIKDEARISKKEIELLCSELNPSLIIFDQIDKIDGFEAERYDLKMKSIYNFGRELSKTYGPVIAVCQAGSTGEGKKWLGMNDVDSSHTAKQGEADWMLGIGKTFDDDYKEVRYMHLSKNKLHGDKNCDPSLRHGKWETRIIPEIAQYADFQ